MKLLRWTRLGHRLAAVDPSVRSGAYPWIAMGIILVGTSAVVVGISIVNIALYRIGVDLSAERGIEWVVTSYVMGVAMVQLVAGWISDRWRKKRAFTLSLTIFIVGSTLATAASSLPLLVAARFVQGLGGGAIFSIGMATIYELFPPERRGRAVGIWGVAVMMGPAIGPLIGGWIATTTSWRWVFAINIPIGLIGLALVFRFLHDDGYQEVRPLNWVSLGLATVGLSAVLVALERASASGWISLSSLGVAVVGLGTMTWFVRRELVGSRSLLSLRMFQEAVFARSVVIGAVITATHSVVLVFIPLELQLLHDLTPLAAGSVLVPTAATTALAMAVSGRISDRTGPRLPVSVGLTLSAVAMWVLADLSPSHSTAGISAVLALLGFGMGMALVPNMVAGMNALDNRFLARASSVRVLMLQFAASISIVAFAGLVTGQVGSVVGDASTTPGALQSAYNRAFLVALIAVVVAAVLSFWLPNARQTRNALTARASEYARFGEAIR